MALRKDGGFLAGFNGKHMGQMSEEQLAQLRQRITGTLLAKKVGREMAEKIRAHVDEIVSFYAKHNREMTRAEFTAIIEGRGGL